MTTSDAPRPRPVTPRQAARILSERDPVIARLRAEAGPPVFPEPTGTHFATLVRSVTFQQLAGAAAQAIHGRLIQVLDGDVTPERLLATPTELLRGAGLSARKAASSASRTGLTAASSPGTAGEPPSSTPAPPVPP